MAIRKRMLWIIPSLSAGIFLVILVLLSSCSGFFNNNTPANAHGLQVIENQTKENHLTAEIPKELKEEMENMAGNNLPVSRWEIDPFAE